MRSPSQEAGRRKRQTLQRCSRKRSSEAPFRIWRELDLRPEGGPEDWRWALGRIPVGTRRSGRESGAVIRQAPHRRGGRPRVAWGWAESWAGVVPSVIRTIRSVRRAKGIRPGLGRHALGDIGQTETAHRPKSGFVDRPGSDGNRTVVKEGGTASSRMAGSLRSARFPGGYRPIPTNVRDERLA